MFARIRSLSSLIILGTAFIATGQEAPAPPGRNEPLLRLEAGGPTSFVTTLAFSPDGKTLYAAGFDKVVRAWGLNAATGRFELDQRRHYRVPINPGMDGAINAIAISDDGEWLAVGGLGAMRGTAGFSETGRLAHASALDDQQRLDRGVIYVFATRGPAVKRLFGHRQPVVGLAFAPSRDGKPPILMSAAEDYDGGDVERGEKSGDVRVWNVDKEQLLGEVTNLPKRIDGLRAPGLAAVHTGDKPNQVRVVIGWGDRHTNADDQRRGYLRIWDVDRPNQQLQRHEDGYQNTAILQLPGDEGILTGSFAAEKGQLKTWKVTADAAQVQDQGPLSAPDGSYFFPDVLALCAAKAQAKNYLAAIVRQTDAKGRSIDNHLVLVELPLGGSAKIVRRLPLGLGAAPVVAATPNGEHVAVTGTTDHAIRVYAVKDLLDKGISSDKLDSQILHSSGASMRFVSFAEPAAGAKAKDKAMYGLALSTTPMPQGKIAWRKGDHVLDFGKRGMTDKINDWVPVAPAPGNWQVRRDKGDASVFHIDQGNKATSRIRIPAEQSRLVWALMPPRPPLQTPLLAVAGYVVATGSPRLDLYNARTGAHVRRYEGHSGPINSLAFSPDGRFLASTANDQTVCVWTLTDLGEILDRQGSLRTIDILRQGKDLVVESVDDDSPAKGKLAKGDVVLGYMVAGELTPIDSRREFDDVYWSVKPGAEIIWRVRKGKQTRDVSIAAAQGVDVRKPLFTMFLADDQREWLGWSPLGPFDASGAGAEKYVGWHFNTGNAAEPTKFALLNQYHERFYKKNLLKHLMVEGSLAKALEKHKEANGPRPGARIQDPLGAARTDKGEFIVRERQVQFAILDFTRAPEDVVEWRHNDGDAQTIDAPIGNLWTAPLPERFAAGDRIRVTVRLHEPGKPAASYTRDWTVRYQPPAPRLTFEPQDKGLEKQQERYDVASGAEYVFHAKLETPGQGPKCKVSFWVNDQKMPSEKLFERADEAQAVKQPLKLKEGDNLIKVVAQNEQALAGFEDDERHTLTVRVFHKPSAPVIVVRRIEPIDDEEGPVNFESSQQVIVPVPRVRIVGVVKAQSEIAAAEWQRLEKPGQKAPSEKLADFKADKTEFTFRQEVELRPGPQTIRIVVKTAAGLESVEAVPLLYRPQLPLLSLKAPDNLLRAADPAQAEIAIEGRLLPPRVPGDEIALQAVVVHNNKPGESFKVSSTAQTLPAQKVRLTPGANQIKVTLNHAEDWKGSPSSAEFSVQLVAPPRITALRHEMIGTTPLVNLTAEVQSKAALLDGSVKVLVNNRERQYGSAKFTKAGDGWTVEVKDVPLMLDPTVKDGVKGVHANEIKALVSNDEAQSDPSESIAVAYKEAPPPPPRIELIAPSSAADVTLAEPEVSLVFRVHSAKSLKRVTVTRDHKTLFEATKLEPSTPGVYQFNAPKLPLGWDSNVLKIEAVNDGGPQTALLTLSVAAQPVELLLDSLRIDDRPTAASVKWEVLPDGTRKFLAVPKGRVLLEGRVRWGGQKDELFKQPHDVRLYVNGFQQIPAKLAPASPKTPRERTFKTWVVLNLEENTIEASLPSLPPDERSRKKCTASCQKPNRGRDLHVVFVAPESQAVKSKDLRDRVIRALQAESVERNLYKTGMSFDVLHFHERRELSAPDVSSLLVNIRGILARRAVAGSPNDVVIFYSFVPDTAQPGTKRINPLDLNQMESNHFAHFNGAQALFFDFSGGAGESSALEREFRQAVFRHIQPKQAAQTALLQGLEADMRKATWLDELQPFLKERLQAGSFLSYYPEGLKVQLNPTK